MKNTDKRESVVMATSGIGIIVNLLIAGVKIVIGAATASIAVLSEGVNNATDAFTSVLAMVGTKLSNKRPDRKHPFGYGRIEYLTSLIIAVLILISGYELLTESFDLIFRPAELKISAMTIVIIAVSAVMKFALGVYTIHTGRRIESSSLVAVGTESRNDSLASIVTIVSALVFLIFDVSIDAYAGIFTSLIILKAGFDVLRDTVSELLGRSGKEDLARQLYTEIRATKGVLNAADMMLHSYGPDAYSGSVNIEIDHALTVGEAYAVIHDLQLRIMHEHAVTMVFGIYAVDNDSEESKVLRRQIAEFVRKTEHIQSYHAVYIDKSANRIYCDFIVDYDLKDWESVRRNFLDTMNSLYPNHSVELTLETEYV